MGTRSQRIQMVKTITLGLRPSMHRRLTALSVKLKEPCSLLIRYALGKVLETQNVEIAMKGMESGNHMISVKIPPPMNTQLLKLSDQIDRPITVITRFSIKQILNIKNIRIPNTENLRIPNNVIWG